jgi:hypothetical protein
VIELIDELGFWSLLNAHLPDQCPQTRIDWWPASQVPRFPAPIAAKARAMPSHQRLGSDGRHHLRDRWKPSIQLEEEQPIAVRELNPTAHLALKHWRRSAAFSASSRLIGLNRETNSLKRKKSSATIVADVT